MSQINNFIASMTEKQDLIYKEINHFIVERISDKKEIKVKNPEFYLADPESYDAKERLVTGLSVHNGVAYITMEPELEDGEDGDLWYNINCFMVEDVLNIISNCFD